MLDAMLIIFPAETESQNVINISLAYCQCILAQMTPLPFVRGSWKVRLLIQDQLDACVIITYCFLSKYSRTCRKDELLVQDQRITCLFWK